MRKFIIIFSLVTFSPNLSFGCLNGETKVLKNGFTVYEDYEGVIPNGHQFYIENFEKIIKELDSLYLKTKDIAYLSDKGYVLVIQKKYDEALKLYLDIEKIKPNRYSTASNIGTIYELIGNNLKAYQWIQKAIKINPKSHESSEWLHLKILEAKISGDLSKTSSLFLINTSFGNDQQPKTNLSKKQLETLEKSLYYQLNERISFIKKEDSIISILLFDLANIQLLEKNFRDAGIIYIQSIEYGLNDELIRNRLRLTISESETKLYKYIHNINDLNQYHKILFIVTLIISLMIISVLGFYIYKLKK